jgi:hypothetical protein
MDFNDKNGPQNARRWAFGHAAIFSILAKGARVSAHVLPEVGKNPLIAAVPLISGAEGLFLDRTGGTTLWYDGLP